MEQSVVLALTAATIAQAVLSAHLLYLRSAARPFYLPMAVFLISISIVLSWPIFSTVLPQYYSTIVAFSLPALLLLGPSLWLYVEGITSEAKWCFGENHYRHFVLFGFAFVLALIAVNLPFEVREALLVKGDDSGLTNLPVMQRSVINIGLISAFALILAWLLQSAYYFVKIILRLARYRDRLKDLFASTVAREMKWLSWLLFAVGIVWLVTMTNILADNFFHKTIINRTILTALGLLMIWSLSVWTFRQKPGFDQAHGNDETRARPASADQKYERSALSEEQSSKIAEKIETAMKGDRLYLDASLSLQQLSKYISVSPNYISQTLNETIGMNFFDYVNGHRVEAAKTLLIESQDTVLEIAMMVGFNAKSSFYTAFKKVVHQTPTGFRKANQDAAP